MKKMNWKNVMCLGLLVLASHTVFAAYTTKIVKKTVVKAKEITPIYQENKTNISVTQNAPQFIYQLKSNPTTGFSWFLREYDSSLVTPVNHYFQHSDTKLMGAPGYEFWTFRLKPAAFLVPHQLIIRLVYMRPWQSDETGKQLIVRVTTQR